MRGPYDAGDAVSEYFQWRCSCGMVCERFKWEYAGVTDLGM